jgi:VWFA-related protein
VLVALAAGPAVAGSVVKQDAPKPMFKAGVNLVMVTVVIQNKNGEPVKGLTRDDFQLFDSGEARAIADFHAEMSPVRVAVLMDLSGSMEVSTKMADARAAARQLLSWLDPDRDHAALFGFDTGLVEVVPFSAPMRELDHALDLLKPYGSTSLYDAMAATGRRLASLDGPRRAVVAITDGADTSSEMRPADVANLASGIDVPLYVMAVVLPMDNPTGHGSAVDSASARILAGPLSALARATGGQLFVASAPAHQSVAARRIVSDLRSQYLLTFEPAPGGKPGFHPLSITTRNKDLVVRTRNGYVVDTTSKYHN